MWNKHVNPPSPDTAARLRQNLNAGSQLTETTHLFPFLKKESLSKSLANPPKEAFRLSGYIAKSISPPPSLIQSVKREKQPKTQRADSEGSAVLPSGSCLSSLFVCDVKTRSGMLMTLGKPPPCLPRPTAPRRAAADVLCVCRAVVDAHNLPVDSAGQGTFSPVGGIIPTAAESAGRAFSGGFG